MLRLLNFISARWGIDAAYRTAMYWVPLLGVALGLSLGAWAAYTLGRAPLQVDLAQLRQNIATAQTQAATQFAKALQQAQQRGDALTTQLAARQQHIDQLSREKHHALAQVTTGRVCLGNAALRVLNSAPGLSVAGLPQAASGAAAAGQPIATYASDLDIGQWAIDAGAQHEQCRQRLDALIDWHTPDDPTKAAP